MSAADLRPVLWAAPSIEKPGAEVLVVETDPAKPAIRAFEGKDGEFEPVSVEIAGNRALDWAKLVVRGDPAALADARILTGLATAYIALFERGLEPARMIGLPKKKDPVL